MRTNKPKANKGVKKTGKSKIYTLKKTNKKDKAKPSVSVDVSAANMIDNAQYTNSNTETATTATTTYSPSPETATTTTYSPSPAYITKDHPKDIHADFSLEQHESFLKKDKRDGIIILGAFTFTLLVAILFALF